MKYLLPSSLVYKAHVIRQLNCWSIRCSWSIACRRCSNHIFILNLTHGFNGSGKDNYKMRREAFKFWDLVRLILMTLRYFIKRNVVFVSPSSLFSSKTYTVAIQLTRKQNLFGCRAYHHKYCNSRKSFYGEGSSLRLTLGGSCCKENGSHLDYIWRKYCAVPI